MDYNEDPTKPKPAAPKQGDIPGQAGGNMNATPSPTAAPSAPPPVAGWVQYGDGGWAPPEIASKFNAPTGGASPASPAAPGAAGAPAAGGAPTSISGAFQQALVQQLGGQPAINAQNPAIAPAIQANKLAEDRGLSQSREILAHQAARDGTSMSGGVDAQQLGLAQDSAMRQGQFAGNAVQHLADQQNANLMRALGIGGGLYDAEQGRAFQGGQNDANRGLQRELADMDAGLRGRGLDIQGRSSEGQLNLGLLGLLQGGDQFNQSLAQQGAQFGAGLDTQTLLALIGGL